MPGTSSTRQETRVPVVIVAGMRRRVKHWYCVSLNLPPSAGGARETVAQEPVHLPLSQKEVYHARMRLYPRKACECEGCQEKDALIRILYGKIDYLERKLKESAELNTKCTRH